MWLHIHRKEWKTESYTWTSLDVEGASDSTSPDITKTAKWHGLGDTLVMDWLHAGWQKNYSHTHRRNNGRVCGHMLYAGGGLYYHKAVKPGGRRSHRGTWEWLLYTGVCAILICRKFQNIVSQLLQEAEYGTTVLCWNPVINLSMKCPV